MKPKFALDLSHEGINLLHRRKGGWSLVGTVDLDDPEMGAHLADLRRRAAALESGGLTCKIIIPNSQVLYTTLEAPGPDDIAREVQIRSGLDILGPLLPQIQSGALKPLAVTGARRSRVLPDVPTAQEAGVKGLDATSWNGLAVPRGTPPEAVQALNAAVNAALKDPAVRQRLESLNLDPHPGTPQDAAAMLHGDIKRWTEVIAKAGIEKL